MGGTSDLTLFVVVQPPHHYFYCHYHLAQVVSQGPALVSMDLCPPDL